MRITTDDVRMKGIEELKMEEFFFVFFKVIVIMIIM